MPRLRVLVVDDSVVMRRMISVALSRDPDLEVVGVAPHGRVALQKVPQVNPDIITLDVEMPEMDGLETLRELRKTHPKLPVIMFSTQTQKGATATLDALTAGASDYVAKPSNVGSVGEGLQRLEFELIPKIKALCGFPEPVLVPAMRRVAAAPVGSEAKPVDGTSLPRRTARKVPSVKPLEILAIGASTGGPNALTSLFRSFPASFPLPIVLVQHMPPLFTSLLSERLTDISPFKFHEGEEGETLEQGRGYVAPGGKHMVLRREEGKIRIHLNEDPPENSCRPAVDVLFRSVAQAYGSGTLAAVLTGMGCDGMRGCELIRERGGQVIVQDEASSVVWGMPKAVYNAGYADKVLPLDQICGDILRRVQESGLRF